MVKEFLIGSCFLLISFLGRGQRQDSSTNSVVINGKLFTAIYQQTAAEYRALCLQAYNIARLRVDEALKKQKRNGQKPFAIVTDIDETILDNSPNAAHQSLQGKDYESSAWKEWSDMANADTVPGAFSFLKYASSKGIQVFYITNRKANERIATIENLKKYHFPNTDSMHLFTRVYPDSSSKESRRLAGGKKYNVILLLGDNLGDFSAFFDTKHLAERRENVDKVSYEFGNKFIVLPNPGYGDWESSLYDLKRLTTAQKDSVIKTKLKTY
jgi:5'-nucleotidase (lipoprotein e(P4) family)